MGGAGSVGWAGSVGGACSVGGAVLIVLSVQGVRG